uniref:Uncharacterized protein n=1 Tax=Brassica oleracea TaxID=3712 RepID=A0A3P6CDA6_BRAOL|nr:unnamed protein product [Brassica oleracea]
MSHAQTTPQPAQLLLVLSLHGYRTTKTFSLSAMSTQTVPVMD